jgi:hypothetical protein
LSLCSKWICKPWTAPTALARRRKFKFSVSVWRTPLRRKWVYFWIQLGYRKASFIFSQEFRVDMLSWETERMPLHTFLGGSICKVPSCHHPMANIYMPWLTSTCHG